jgi:formate hydrogenlyase transcriptional activator
VDVRVIAATNRDVQEALRTGRFRSDLFYRLNVFPIEVPPLRDRRSDIPQLATFFLSRFAKKFGKRVGSVSPGTMDRLVSYAWPGNIRELQNVMERAVVLCERPVLELDQELVPVTTAGWQAHDPESPSGTRGRGKQSPRESEPSQLARMKDVERQHILAALDRTGGVIDGPRGAARILDLHPNTLRSRMAKLGIALKRARHDIS